MAFPGFGISLRNFSTLPFRIVACFNVKEYLTQLATALYLSSPDQVRHLAQRRHQELDTGRLGALHNALARPALVVEKHAIAPITSIASGAGCAI